MKKIENITIEQAKQVLPAWLEFLKATSDAKLTEHPFVSKITALWTKYFAPVLDEAFYQEQIRITTPKECKIIIKRCNWVSVGMDKTDNTEKFIPTCDEGRGMPFKNSGYLKYCPFCGKQIGWTTSSLLGEPEEQLPLCAKCNVKHRDGLACIPPDGEAFTEEVAMNDTDLYIKRQRIKDYLAENKIPLISYKILQI